MKLDDVKTGSLRKTRRSPGETPAFCLGGVRHKGSANLNQALVWNVGTCRPDDKGETQVRGPHEGESTDVGHRGGMTYSSDEVS
jgi:hypothetical protein